MKKKFLMAILVLSVMSTALYAYTTLQRKAILAAAFLKNEGYVLRGLKSGCLNEGEYTYRTVYLYSGNSYAIIGVGDYIRDLDTTIYDSNWNRISSDTDTSGTSVVRVTPRWDGKFYIKVKAYRGSGCYAQVMAWK
jgi:hypothetical protein